MTFWACAALTALGFSGLVHYHWSIWRDGRKR